MINDNTTAVIYLWKIGNPDPQIASSYVFLILLPTPTNITITQYLSMVTARRARVNGSGVVSHETHDSLVSNNILLTVHWS